MTKCGKFLCLLVQLRLKSTKLTLKSTTTLTTKDNGSFLPKKCCPRLFYVVVNKKKVYQQSERQYDTPLVNLH